VRVLFVAMAVACAAPKPPAQPEPTRPGQRAPSDRLTLLFSASVAGQLVPCGCSPDQRGGLPRELALVRKLRRTEPNMLFVDAGDLLFEAPSPPPAQMLTQRQLKARTLARGDALLGAAARAIGPRDLALGASFVAETAGGVPLLDAGGGPVPGARATLLANAGPIKVGFFAAGQEADAATSIAARARALREQGASIVVSPRRKRCSPPPRLPEWIWWCSAGATIPRRTRTARRRGPRPCSRSRETGRASCAST